MKLPTQGTVLSWAAVASTAASAIFGGPAIEATIQNSNVEIHGNQFSLFHIEQVIEAPDTASSELPTQKCHPKE